MYLWNVEVNPDAALAHNATVMGNVHLAEKVSVYPNSVIRADNYEIAIGNETNIQDNCTVHVSVSGPCHIGSKVTVGHNAIIHGCIIEDECLIGMGAIVMDHARVGRGSVIGAGALVPEGMEVPPYSLVVGIPARIKRSITPEEHKEQLRQCQMYVEESQAMAQAGVFYFGSSIPFDHATILLKQS